MRFNRNGLKQIWCASKKTASAFSPRTVAIIIVLLCALVYAQVDKALQTVAAPQGSTKTKMLTRAGAQSGIAAAQIAFDAASEGAVQVTRATSVALSRPTAPKALLAQWSWRFAALLLAASALVAIALGMRMNLMK